VTASPADTVGETRIAVDSVTLERLATQGPAVQAALAGQTSAHAAARAARAPYFPTLSVSYSGNNSATDTALTLFAGLNPRFSGSLRFTLSYPIFNQFTREQNIELAQVAEDNATAAARDAALLARQNLVTYLGALRTAEQQIGIQQVSVAAAEEDLRVQQQRYQLHASTLLDVLTSQTALNQARAALIQARYNYRVAKAQLESLVGRTL
jgi:outer membrane protein